LVEKKNLNPKDRELKKKIESHPEDYKISAASPTPQVIGGIEEIPEAEYAAKYGSPENLDAMSTENSDMRAEENKPVVQQVVNNDNRTINPPARNNLSQNEPGIINVRNMEPTAGAYLANIFNHPVSRVPG
jgi:hypothetical protein